MEQPAAGGGSDEAGVVAQLRITDPGALGGNGKGQLRRVIADAIQQGRAGRDHAAAKDNHFRVDHVHQAHGSDAQVIGRVLLDLAGQGIAGMGRVKDVPGGQLCGRFAESVQGGSSAILVECFLARLTTAVALAYASRQPPRPQPHSRG